jgi:hypothetical protein
VYGIINDIQRGQIKRIDGPRIMDQNEFEVIPATCVYGGDALARLPDGRAVFIPFAIPGET